MSRTVLFAGGPLHGQVRTVDDRTRTVCALELPEISLDPFSPPFNPYEEPLQVTYNVSRFAMCGRLIWIGHCGAEPDEFLVFDVVTSYGAKQASVLA